MGKIEIKNTDLYYGDFHALKNINLDIPANQITAFIGPSGCGKSTLLKSLNRMNDLVEGCRITGELLLDGEDIYGPMDVNLLRRRVGMVFQSYDLFPHMDVLGNLVLGPTRALKRPSKEVEAEAMAALARVGLADRAHALPRQLSGSQKQRAALVRAMLLHPELLLLEAITAALDPEMVGEVLFVMRQLAKEGMTMLVVTHEMAFARDISTHVVYMNGGVICEEGTPQQIFNNPQKAETRDFLARFIAG